MRAAGLSWLVLVLALGCRSVGGEFVLGSDVEVTVTPEQPAVGEVVRVVLHAGGSRLADQDVQPLLRTNPPGILEPLGDGTLQAVAAGSVTLSVVATGFRKDFALEIPCPEGATSTVSHSGVIAADEEWSAAAGVHRVEGELRIDGATLTLGACSKIEMAANASIVVGENAPAQILVRGSREHPVAFQGEVVGGSRARWGGIRVFAGRAQGSSLSGLLIEDADGLPDDVDPTELAAVEIIGPVDDFFKEPPLALQETTIVGCADVGVRLRSVHAQFAAHWTGVRVQGCNGHPLSLDAASLGALPVRDLLESQYVDNGTQAVKLVGGWAGPQSQLWRNPGIPYDVTETIVVQPNPGAIDPFRNVLIPYLHIEHGCEFRFRTYDDHKIGLYVGSGVPEPVPAPRPVILSIVGTDLSPVIFTSGAASPAPGDWIGVVLMPNVQVRLSLTALYLSAIEGAIIEYAGAPNGVTDADGNPVDNGGLVIRQNNLLFYNVNSAFFLSGVLIRRNAGFGIVSPNFQMFSTMLSTPRSLGLTSCACDNELGPISLSLAAPDSANPEPGRACPCTGVVNWSQNP